MTKPRSAAEILAYCEQHDTQSHVRFELYAHTDLPAAVRAAVELRRALMRLLSLWDIDDLPDVYDETNRVYGGTAWLEPDDG